MGAGLTAYLKSEFSNWGKGETIWLFSASAVILGRFLAGHYCCTNWRLVRSTDWYGKKRVLCLWHC